MAVEKKSTVLPELLHIACERTVISGRVTDEFYSFHGIGNAS